jgi:nicotinamide-nucleotide amidase
MTREKEIPHKIAILATGDEITNGDIINSNSQEIAARLSRLGMHVRMHIVAPDTLHELEEAMRFLLQSHDALITTGGLGPTSDDLTRFALSKVTNVPLIFDEATWQEICTRLQRFGYKTPPESNRQQAYFPDGAKIIPNSNGTAAGSILKHKNRFIVMLPGPPNECLVMLDKIVLPELIQAGFQHVSYHKNWLLFGASEGKIAEELDLLAKPYDCVTGYRLFYPYIEFKLHSNNFEDYNQLLPILEKALEPYLIGDGHLTASQLLREKLEQSQINLEIVDQATGAALAAQLNTPKTRSHLQFYHDTKHFADNTVQIEIQGLTEFWEGKSDTHYAHLQIIFTGQKQQKKVDVDIPFRGNRVIHYAVEFICTQIYAFLQMQQADSNFHQN